MTEFMQSDEVSDVTLDQRDPDTPELSGAASPDCLEVADRHAVLDAKSIDVSGHLIF
jgi:hypothetical protein